MEGVLVLLAIIGLFSLLDVAAMVFGVDSTDGSSDPRSPVGLSV
ncbi:MAG TPA: hypothetical protein VIV06_06905 [Candidatus Limnocylindrales bacterium]